LPLPDSKTLALELSGFNPLLDGQRLG
jgi:hypothetical protein